MSMPTSRKQCLCPLDSPLSFSAAKKRWRSASAKIYSIRTFLSLAKVTSPRKEEHKLSRSPSYTVVSVCNDKVEDESFKIDPRSLTELVKEKNLHRLGELNGIPGVTFALKTNIDAGIRDEEIGHRREAFGSNTYKKPPSKSFFHFVVEAFKDLTILILLSSGALSLALGVKKHGLSKGWYDGGSTFVAAFLNVVVSTVSNYRKHRELDKSSEVSNNIQVEVARNNGRRQNISIFEIVVGDVIFLKIGDQVPADGLFLDGHSLRVDESSMTGENEHVEVNSDGNPFLFAGTKVVDGYASMIATSVGMNTTRGQMMSQISRDTSEQTPLQARLNKLTSSIGKVGLTVAFLVFLVLLIRYLTANTTDENGNKEFNGSNTKFDDIVNAVLEILAASANIVVVAIPEGLPVSFTLILAYSMKRMMADQAMVRKLSACETMGSATVICTDKTGTLTLNQMKVTEFWLGQEPVKKDAAFPISPRVLELVKQWVALNTTGSVYRATTGAEFEFSGSSSEKAILSWAVQEFSMDMEETKQGYDILNVETFNSEKKWSGVMMRKKTDNTVHIHKKGDAELILAMCSSYSDASGNVKHLGEGDSARETFRQIIQGMASRSLRCIAFAHKDVAEEKQEDGKDKKGLNEGGFTLIGLAGIKDPCRQGVKTAVEDCQGAGVSIKMITGDNVFTAKAIATECGILRPNMDLPEAVVEGEEFRNYTPDERMEKVDKICVMARSSPNDKLLMVQCLKQKGHVVAVTGDGTNDAPALKEADIGLSMGIQGTEVAKESSDIVIIDHSFTSVVTSLRWGRCVDSNVQKFIQFQLPVNVAALVINFVAAISGVGVPLTAVQLLWVNMIVNTLGALALATEQPNKELMEQPPVGRTKQALITNVVCRNLLAQALYQIAILLILQFRGELIFDVNEKVKDTLIFNTFVLSQIFNLFNARKIEKKNIFQGILKNKPFLGITSIIIVLQVLMVEFLKKIAATERLNWGQWGACIFIQAVSWAIGCVVRCIPVPEKPFLG